MKKNVEKDTRVKEKHVSWREYALTFFVLQALTAGQMLIYSAYVDLKDVPSGYIWAMVGYWSIVALIFCLVTDWQKLYLFDRPIRRLSEAAKLVANGDFSVFVPPVHTADKKDYIDILFEDFNTMVKELGSIEIMKNEFIANVSHEIKTPLSIIQNYAMALQKEELPTDMRKEYIETIINASKKLSGLVSNILKLNKLESQGIKPARKPYDLCRQLTECALSFEDLWEQKQIEFEVNIEDKAVIRSDENMLELVWNNLLSNALKFTEPGGKVVLTQTSDVDMVTVSVSDTGCGMNEKTMNHIFDKFYQGDTSHSGEGNGLGLALTARVIDLLDGTLSVKSEPGKGSVFIVSLKA